MYVISNFGGFMLNIDDYKGAERVFRFFEEFSAIPHGSGNTGKIADYLVNFAKERGLEYIRDTADNVVIKKPATKAPARPAAKKAAPGKSGRRK